MKQLVLFTVLFLAAFSGFSQKREPVDIQYIALQDTTLVQEIEKLIQDQVNREVDTSLVQELEILIQDQVSREADTTTQEKAFTKNFFKKGLGYVRLYIESNLHGAYFHQGDTLARYYMAPSLVGIDKDEADNVYPPFYSYVGGRLVLVYVPILERVATLRFSDKSKKMLRKRVDAFLEKPQDVTAYNPDGSVAFRDKNFRIDYFRFHNGKYVYILKNQPPVVVFE